MDVKNVYSQYILNVMLLVLNIRQTELNRHHIQWFSNGVPRHTIVRFSFCYLDKETLIVTLRSLSTA